jgi:predicted DNA-binding protein (UPF0251 family)
MGRVVRIPRKKRAVVYDKPHARHHHPNIGGSKAGAYSVSFRAGSQKALLLDAYYDFGKLNASEAAEHAGLLDATFWMRCSELRDAGLIEPVMRNGEVLMRPGHKGSLQMVCRITDAGRRVVESSR